MHRYTFSKSERLLKKREFVNVYENGMKEIGVFLIAYILKNTPERKLGISVSSKLGGAIIRNRAKRLIREAYRLTKHQLTQNIHLVISARSGIIGLKYNEVEKELLEIYRKAGLL